MYLKKNLKNLLNKTVMHYGYEIIDSSKIYDWQRLSKSGPSYNNKSMLPEGAKDYLQINNPKLIGLQKRYSVFNNEIHKPLMWKNDNLRTEDILYFRGDNAYVWQLRGPNMNILSYALSAYYLMAIDKLELFSKLFEDDFFGNYTFNMANKLVSRDLLDSIIEIYFLERHLNISSPSKRLNILDIGAGYGRLAHRFPYAIPNLKHYFCTDGVALSTFISDYYLHFRKLEDRVCVIPLDEIEDTLTSHPIDIALNIHSFSECRTSAIEWWLCLLAKYEIKHLMIVPDSFKNGGKLLLTKDQKDFKEIVEKHGYKLVVKEPKYCDPVVQKYGINPTYHYLFEFHS